MARSSPPALVLLLLACLLALASAPLASAQYFIFGYGSLLNTASTEKSNCGLSGFAEGDLDGLLTLLTRAFASANGDNATSDTLLKTLSACQVQGQRVVRIQGLERGWYTGALSFGGTPVNPWGSPNGFGAAQLALGAIVNPKASITGLIYEVDEVAYNNTLAREAGYDVVEIDSDSPDITVLGGPALPAGTKIAYFGQNVSTIMVPSARVPIAYSYIDIWLGGAVDLQKKFGLSGASYLAGSGGKYNSFVEETIKTTSAWSSHIVNDRTYPHRSFVMTRNAGAIDAALWQFVPPNYLKGIRFPGQAKPY